MNGTPHDSSPQYEQMADESMIRCLRAQADAIWPLERPLFDRYALNHGEWLDLGCGTGEIAFRIAEAFPRVRLTGVDLVESHLEIARHRANDDVRFRFECGDAMALRYADNQFDLSICRHLLQAVPDARTVLAELIRVTRPGGWLHLLAEDYGMMHFHPTDRDVDRFWRDGIWVFGDAIGTDLRSGRKISVYLRELGISEIHVDYLPVDTERVPRETLRDIFVAWRDGYAGAIGEHTTINEEDALAYFQAILDCCDDPQGYALWQVPIIAARVP